MIAVKPCDQELKTYKVRCPECHGRICDFVIDNCSSCSHRYRIVLDEKSNSQITIKCRKCGMVVGIAFVQDV